MIHPERLLLPETWRNPQRVFLNSMSDLFHRDVPNDVIDAHFDMMERVDRHIYQALTKRAERMTRYVNNRYTDASCPPHIWLGVSVEDECAGWRADMLRLTNASVRWISAEPLLGPLDSVSLDGIAWVVAGGESGRGARPMDIDWARGLRDRCVDQGTAFFLKQLGGEFRKRGKDEAVLDGVRWTKYPAVGGGPA